MTWILIGIGACVLATLLVLVLVAIAPRIEERQEWEDTAEAEYIAARRASHLAATERWRQRKERDKRRGHGR